MTDRTDPTDPTDSSPPGNGQRAADAGSETRPTSTGLGFLRDGRDENYVSVDLRC